MGVIKLPLDNIKGLLYEGEEVLDVEVQSERGSIFMVFLVRYRHEGKDTRYCLYLIDIYLMLLVGYFDMGERKGVAINSFDPRGNIVVNHGDLTCTYIHIGSFCGPLLTPIERNNQPTPYSHFLRRVVSAYNLYNDLAQISLNDVNERYGVVSITTEMLESVRNLIKKLESEHPCKMGVLNTHGN